MLWKKLIILLWPKVQCQFLAKMAKIDLQKKVPFSQASLYKSPYWTRVFGQLQSLQTSLFRLALSLPPSLELLERKQKWQQIQLISQTWSLLLCLSSSWMDLPPSPSWSRRSLISSARFLFSRRTLSSCSTVSSQAVGNGKTQFWNCQQQLRLVHSKKVNCGYNSK